MGDHPPDGPRDILTTGRGTSPSSTEIAPVPQSNRESTPIDRMTVTNSATFRFSLMMRVATVARRHNR
jgi:hypothetical protein